jgi:hypothetical protein
MPQISRFYGIIIAMFFDEHNPPHFHATYGEYKASIRIKDFALMEGRLPPKAYGLVAEWASLHQDELFSNWELARLGNDVVEIEPLI